MSVGTLFYGLFGIFALLIFGGLFGGIGSVELSVWLGLEVVWVLWWMRSRRGNAKS